MNKTHTLTTPIVRGASASIGSFSATNSHEQSRALLSSCPRAPYKPNPLTPSVSWHYPPTGSGTLPDLADETSALRSAARLGCEFMGRPAPCPLRSCAGSVKLTPHSGFRSRLSPRLMVKPRIPCQPQPPCAAGFREACSGKAQSFREEFFRSRGSGRKNRN